MNPTDKPCWRTCVACYRCAEKGTKPECYRCSGRFDPKHIRDDHDFDDRCRCTEGILQIRIKTETGKPNGRLIQTKYPYDPFQGNVKSIPVSQDEQDWESYKKDMRERLDQPDWDPIQVYEQ